MWSRYCKGDMPYSKHMELLQQQHQEQILSEECDCAVKISEPRKITINKDGTPEPIMENGFCTGSSSFAKATATEQNAICLPS